MSRRSPNEIFEWMRETQCLSDERIENIKADFNRYNDFFNDKKRLSSRQIRLWFKEQGELRRESDRTCDNPLEALAMISAALYRETGGKITPRDTQVITVLSAWTSARNPMLEVRTGEGKSFIVVMMAALMVLMRGYKVDIITSSPNLADREPEEHRSLLALMNLTCASINSEKQETEERVANYEVDILFSTAHNFEGDILRKHNGVSIRGSRPFDVIIADEADNLFIDRIMYSTLLSRPVAGFHHLHTPLGMIWQTVTAYLQRALGSPVLVSEKLYFADQSARDNVADWILDCLRHTNVVDSLDGLAEVLCHRLFQGGQDNTQLFEKYNLSMCDLRQLLGMMKNIIQNDHAKLLQLLSEESILDLSCAIYEEERISSSRKPRNDSSTELSQLICSIAFRGGCATNTVSDDEIDLYFYHKSDGTWTMIREADFNEIERALQEQVDRQISEWRYSSEFSHLPSEIRNWASNHSSAWVKSALKACCQLEENEQYVCDANQDQIVIVDRDNTGVLQKRMKYTDGLHQFLCLKHNVPMEPVNATSNCMTNSLFFSKYRQRIGITGTVGGEAEIKYFQTFEFDCIKIPTFCEKQLTREDDVLAMSTADWIQEIVSSVRHHADQGQAILVICKSIHLAHVIQKSLPSFRCDLYERDDTAYNSVIETRAYGSGHVVVSTNLAGRGTDIKLSQSVKDNGGLHVILSFLTPNQRVEDQAIGRTARKGLPGTAQIIIDYSDLDAKYKNLCNEVDKILCDSKLDDCSQRRFLLHIIQRQRLECAERFLENLGNHMTNQKRLEQYYIRFEQFLVSNDTIKDVYKAQLRFAFANVYERLEKLNDEDDEKGCEAEYSSFENDCRYGSDDAVYNEYALVFHAITETKKFSDEEDYLRKAVNRLGRCGAFAHFRLAFVLTRISQNADKPAPTKSILEHLNKAKEGFAYECQCRDYFLGMVAGTSGATPILRSLGKEKEFFHGLVKTIDKAWPIVSANRNLSVERKAVADTEGIFLPLETHPDRDVEMITSYYQTCGLVGYYTFEKRYSWRDAAKAFGAFCISCLMIFAGTLLTVCTGGIAGAIGASLISTGIDGVCESIKGMYNGDFDFEAWAKKSCLKFALNMICSAVKWCVGKATAWVSDNLQRLLPPGAMERLQQAREFIGGVRERLQSISNPLGDLNSLTSQLGVGNEAIDRLMQSACQAGIGFVAEKSGLQNALSVLTKPFAVADEFLGISENWLSKADGSLLDSDKLCNDATARLFGEDALVTQEMRRARPMDFDEDETKELEDDVWGSTATRVAKERGLDVILKESAKTLMKETIVEKLLSEFENQIEHVVNSSILDALISIVDTTNVRVLEFCRVTVWLSEEMEEMPDDTLEKALMGPFATVAAKHIEDLTSSITSEFRGWARRLSNVNEGDIFSLVAEGCRSVETARGIHRVISRIKSDFDREVVSKCDVLQGEIGADFQRFKAASAKVTCQGHIRNFKLCVRQEVGHTLTRRIMMEIRVAIADTFGELVNRM